MVLDKPSVKSSTESDSVVGKTKSDDNTNLNVSDLGKENSTSKKPAHDKSEEIMKVATESSGQEAANSPSCVSSAGDSSSPTTGKLSSTDDNETSQNQTISQSDRSAHQIVSKSASPPTPTSQQSNSQSTFFSNLMKLKRKKKKDSTTSSSAANLNDVITQVERPTLTTASSNRNRVTSFHNSSWRSLFCCGCQWKRRYQQRYLDDQRMSGISGKLSCLSSHNGIYQPGGPVLLQAIREEDRSKKCLIIDLDETLVHSSFKAVDNADFKVGVDIEGTVHQVYVLKRPYVDQFLKQMANIYECVLFTASLAKYADPVADFLDQWSVFRHRLFRDACVYHRGNYVKDLSRLGRPLEQIVILDNSPASYLFHTTHAVQVTSWFDDPNDHALLDLIPYFESLAKAPNVPDFLAEHLPPLSATGVLSIHGPVLSATSMPTHILSPPVCPPIPSATPPTMTPPPLNQKGDSGSSSSSSTTINKSSPTSTTDTLLKRSSLNAGDLVKVIPVSSASATDPSSSNRNSEVVKS